ncbi:MAG: class I SAM-dependent methyltransferase, partial [Clostridiales bacterium]|nr:class I SAM-dependent methyltransferase [Clostridiales bacterium]
MYQDFAYLYDEFMKNVDYQDWTNKVEDIFRKYDKQPKTIVDLACGTGGVTNLLATRGYKVTGVDISEDMLYLAREKARKSGLQVPYICQDISELSLHNPVDAILCMCDGFNYILEKRKLKQSLKKIHKYLNPGGILIFDISSHYKLSSILGNNTM